MSFLKKRNIKTIWVKPNTYLRLIALKGILQTVSPNIVSFDDVINKLLDFYEKGGKVEVKNTSKTNKSLEKGDKKQ